MIILSSARLEFEKSNILIINILTSIYVVTGKFCLLLIK